MAQNPSAVLVAPPEVCANEEFEILNNSVNSARYVWDFCMDDFLTTPLAEDLLTVTEANLPTSFKVVYDSSRWYGFLSSRDNSKLFRLDFGENLQNTPNVVDLGNLGGVLKGPKDISFLKENGIWYGILINVTNSRLVKLKFNGGLETIPIATDLGNLNALSTPRGLDVAYDGDSLVAIISNYGSSNYTLVNFGSSVNNVLGSEDIKTFGSGSSVLQPMAITLLKNADKWYAISASYGNNKIFKITFLGSLFSSVPTITEVATVSRPLTPFLLQEGNHTVGFISSVSGDLHRLNFKDNLDNAPEILNLGKLGVLSQIHGFYLIKQTPNWYGFAINYNTNKMFRISFPDDCTLPNSYLELTKSTEVSVKFSEAGQHPINLTAFDIYGNKDDVTQFITVTEDQAPLIDFQISSQCIGSISTLNSAADQPLTSTTWTINNETRTGETVTYNFPAPGTYPVTLEVESANGCGNRLTKEITIYEPPVPNFTAPAGQICTNGAVNFTNTTDAKGADSLITYQWFVDNELVSEEVNPAITFAEGGAKTVRLEAGIPGCTETTEQTLTVLPGPTVGFTVAQICQADLITFENVTTGESITGYTWDFGDGGSFASATPENPTYVYQEAGTYTVALTAANTLGCQNVYQQEVTVFEQPQVGFLSEVACVGTPTQFTDTTSAGTNANVITWQWDFGDGLGTDNVRNPTYAYPQPGTYQVKLITQTTAGCTDSAFQTVTVESPVATGFTATQQCPIDNSPYTLLLTDTSVVAQDDEITRWFWTVNGENFVSSEVAYAFPAPGRYEVSLTAFATSGCNATVTQTVQVDSLPELTFTYAEGCTGEPLAFQSQVVANSWDIASYAWEFGGVGTAFTANPEFTFPEPGTYQVTLTVQTANDCSFTVTQSVVVAVAPVAAFTASPTFGGAPLEVTFENTSTDATHYAWGFAGPAGPGLDGPGLGTSEEKNPVFTFTETGTYTVTLTATNAQGCTATTQQTVEVVPPVQDLRLEAISLSESPIGGARQLLLTLSNRGTLVASGITVTITLDEAVTIQEQLTQPVLPGETLVYPTRFQLPVAQRNQRNPLRYLCVSLVANDANFVEEQPENNRDCISLNQQLNVEPPFPNPASEQLQVSVILPEADAVSLRLMNQEGKVLRQHRQEATVAGLNTFLLNVKGLPVGAYLLQITYQGEHRQFRVGVGP